MLHRATRIAQRFDGIGARARIRQRVRRGGEQHPRVGTGIGVRGEHGLGLCNRVTGGRERAGQCRAGIAQNRRAEDEDEDDLDDDED